MKARIHRGAAEVGGSCVELEANGQILLLDVGLPLSDGGETEARLPESAERGDALAAVISHSHPDHFGLVDRLHPRVPVFMGEAGAEILKAASFYTTRPPPRVDQFLADGITVLVGPFRITPYLVDHSAFDAYALLIEADGRRLFYSGDLRAHGRKPGAFTRLMERPPPDVDVMLLEGTTVGRAAKGGGVADEKEVEERCVTAFRNTEGLVLACYSPQNVDRLVTVYKAALRSDRDLVMDLYAADVAAACNRDTIPQVGSEWERVRLYIPNSQRVRVKESGEFWRIDRRRRQRVFAEELAADPSRWVMTFRTSMAAEVERGGCLPGACAYWLMWPGYLDQADDRTRATFERLGIELEIAHVSGHASVPDLQRIARGIAAKRVVPIHTSAPERFDSLFARVEPHADGEWWAV
jgi:ribonuclease J